MVRKSEAEVALIRESARWCEHAHRLLQQYTRPGATEAQASLQAGHEATLAMLETLGSSYGGQQASSDGVSAGYRGQIGLRSAWAHAVAHNIEFRAGDVLVTETSAPIWGYNAELERAMIIGTPTDEMRRLFDHAVAAQQVAFDALRPGVTCADVDGAVLRYFEANDLLPYWRAAHGPRDRPAQPRGAVPRRRRSHADRARHGVHDRARPVTRRGRRLPPLRHGGRHARRDRHPHRLPERHRLGPVAGRSGAWLPAPRPRGGAGGGGRGDRRGPGPPGGPPGEGGGAGAGGAACGALGGASRGWLPRRGGGCCVWHATAALAAGKAVYCEWPLGNGLEEAEKLAALAKTKGVLAVAGLQARAAPSVAYVRDLIGHGYVGEVLSTTLIGSGMGWGPTVDPYNAYMNDKTNGATMLSIPLGHTADALCHCLGEVRELSATMTVRRKSFTIGDTGERQPMTTEDQVAVTGLLEGGAAFSIHYRGGRSRGTNLLWEINGTDGDLQLTADGGHAQIFEMTVRGGNGAQSSLDILPVPQQYRWAPPQGPSTNVAQAYARLARDYREGTHLCPTFDDAVTRHRMLDAIETAAVTGQRQTPA